MQIRILASLGSQLVPSSGQSWCDGPVTVLFVVLVIVVIGLIGLAAVGRLGELPPVEPDLRPDRWDGYPAFDVVLRGYRMDEVDAVVTTLQREVTSLRAELAAQREA